MLVQNLICLNPSYFEHIVIADVVAKFTIVMLEEAPVAIWAESLGEELLAFFRLVFIILRLLANELVLTMGKLTF